jgi:ABC-type branched-subunit amino acid transport system ATPase component
MNLVMGICDRIVVLNFGEILGGNPYVMRPGRTGPVAPGQ